MRTLKLSEHGTVLTTRALALRLGTRARRLPGSIDFTGVSEISSCFATALLEILTERARHERRPLPRFAGVSAEIASILEQAGAPGTATTKTTSRTPDLDLRSAGEDARA